MCRILEAGHQRGVDLGRAARLPAHRRATRGRAARGGVPGGRHVVLHLGHRPGLRQRPAAADPARRVRAGRLGAGDGDPQLRHLRPGRGALRDHGLRPGRSTARRCCSSPARSTFAWGGVVVDDRRGARRRARRDPRDARAPARGRRRSTSPPAAVEAGTTAALRFEVQGIVDGRPAIVVEHVTRLRDDLAPDWPQPGGHGSYRILIEGSPTLKCELELLDADGDHNGGRPHRHRHAPAQRHPRGVRGRARPALHPRPAPGDRPPPDALTPRSCRAQPSSGRLSTTRTR